MDALHNLHCRKWHPRAVESAPVWIPARARLDDCLVGVMFSQLVEMAKLSIRSRYASKHRSGILVSGEHPFYHHPREGWGPGPIQWSAWRCSNGCGKPKSPLPFGEGRGGVFKTGKWLVARGPKKPRDISIRAILMRNAHLLQHIHTPANNPLQRLRRRLPRWRMHRQARSLWLVAYSC